MLGQDNSGYLRLSQVTSGYEVRSR
jgi:hypothetical protein